MLSVSFKTALLALATLIYLVVVGGVLLKRAANRQDARITHPFITMLQVGGVSGIVFALASVPSYVAQLVSPDILPFIMPYMPVLFVVSFVVLLLKLESRRSGRYQAAVALSMAATITVFFMLAQVVMQAVF